MLTGRGEGGSFAGIWGQGGREQQKMLGMVGDTTGKRSYKDLGEMGCHTAESQQLSLPLHRVATEGGSGGSVWKPWQQPEMRWWLGPRWALWRWEGVIGFWVYLEDRASMFADEFNVENERGGLRATQRFWLSTRRMLTEILVRRSVGRISVEGKELSVT